MWWIIWLDCFNGLDKFDTTGSLLKKINREGKDKTGLLSVFSLFTDKPVPYVGLQISLWLLRLIAFGNNFLEINYSNEVICYLSGQQSWL